MSFYLRLQRNYSDTNFIFKNQTALPEQMKSQGFYESHCYTFWCLMLFRYKHIIYMYVHSLFPVYLERLSWIRYSEFLEAESSPRLFLLRYKNVKALVVVMIIVQVWWSQKNKNIKAMDGQSTESINTNIISYWKQS